ncbi:hypothetical protein R1flu_002872 [Riccia fluitans]|uniref:Uncharacterized protein n=1 Tax=Riccia fluitans TaxID=41844 RepID=A0ABD1YAS8_9MARC
MAGVAAASSGFRDPARLFMVIRSTPSFWREIPVSASYILAKAQTGISGNASAAFYLASNNFERSFFR